MKANLGMACFCKGGNKIWTLRIFSKGVDKKINRLDFIFQREPTKKLRFEIHAIFSGEVGCG